MTRQQTEIRCSDCGEMYPETFMNYPGPICDGCNELARMRSEEYQDYLTKTRRKSDVNEEAP